MVQTLSRLPERRADPGGQTNFGLYKSLAEAALDDHSQAKSKCRHCGATLRTMFADLGATPVSNDYLSEKSRYGPESYYPLRAFVCDSCWLVQLEEFRRANDLFREDYAYFSSVS